MSDPLVRPAIPGDADAIADLLNAHSAALHGESDITRTSVLEWLEDRGLIVCVAEVDARLVCYGDVMFTGDGDRANLDVREHPESASAAAFVLEELEAFARARGATRAWVFHAEEEHAYGMQRRQDTLEKVV